MLRTALPRRRLADADAGPQHAALRAAQSEAPRGGDEALLCGLGRSVFEWSVVSRLGGADSHERGHRRPGSRRGADASASYVAVAPRLAPGGADFVRRSPALSRRRKPRQRPTAHREAIAVVLVIAAG